MFKWLQFLKLKLFYNITDLEYRVRRLERKIYWKEKYGSKEKRIKN